jgi:Family of unknown function (DUF5320)
MPGRDGTGPKGMGAMTGRTAGTCAGAGGQGPAGEARRRGFGMGFGGCRGAGNRGGHGWRRMFQATGVPGWMQLGGNAALSNPDDPEVQKQALEHQADVLRSELDRVTKHLSALETGSAVK